jgi:hypothetical protein
VKGEAFRGFDGYWRHINPSIDLATEKTFIVTALFEDGSEEKVKETFFPETQALMPPGGKRQANCFFRDDFNGALDKGKWKHEVSLFGGMNWEFEVYTPDAANSFTRNGHLYLKPTFTADKFGEAYLTTGVMDMQQLYGVCTNSGNYGCHREGKNGMINPIMSGKLMSIPTVRYGQVEVRAKIPKGDWIWPAIWMMPAASKYGGWPRSGEIDIMESRGNDCPGCYGIHGVSSTLHWGQAWDRNHYGQTHGEKCGPNYAADFHTYKLDWTADHLITHVDADQVLRVEPPAGGFYSFGHLTGENPWAGGGKMAPFDQDFFLILNVAVGGTNGFFPDGVNCGTAKPWPNNSPHANQDFWTHRSTWGPTWRGDDPAMQIDYVSFCH